MTVDRTDIVDRLYRISNDMEDLLIDIRHTEQLDLGEPSSCLSEWKQKVISALPKDCSAGFRIDVEEFLEKIKEIY